MLDPISSLGLHDDPDGDEAAMELTGSGSPSPEPGEDLFGGIAADHLLVHEVRRRGVNMTEGGPGAQLRACGGDCGQAGMQN
ncbi:unnamed protein product [Staurois parvus]|uniref:Uncharacterized protein n=1 Tax=Staurois parvus TaxID=386267 RepID=A0ABN9B441_9NEOB|nr:unnamed protein product [Staurois parvus]